MHRNSASTLWRWLGVSALVLCAVAVAAAPKEPTSKEPTSKEPAKVEAKDVTTTESGLKYTVLKTGKGPGAVKHQVVTVHYNGWVEGGKQFVASRTSGEPMEFLAGRGQVLLGLDEGVLGMAVGETRQLIIPPKLGFGDRAVGKGLIPANSTLVLEVELIELGSVVTSSDKPTAVKQEDFRLQEGGLKYAVLQTGTGEAAKKGQTVRVHYTGWLTNGSKFDSSLDRGEALAFTLGAGMVIKGWDEGVAGMKVGEKRQLVIPSNLGYGEQGYPPDIPGKATLIFEVQLIKIEKPSGKKE